jgi:hypothetical protein
MLQLPLPTLAGRIRGDYMLRDYIPQAVITKMTNKCLFIRKQTYH